jgi:tRNA U34 2-thiouridine synthase MnmA/TrmU
MSTGHYIKVRKQQTSKKFAVFMANDLEADQSELFSGVKQEVLSSMILPLGDLMKTEVHKIFRRAFPHLAEKVGQDRKSCHLFQDINKTAKKNISEDLLVQGKIMMKSKNLSLGEHHGFHEFKVAEEIEEVNAPMDFKGDKFYIYNFSFSENYVYAEPEKYLAIQYLFVKVVYAGADYKVATPLNVAIKIGDDSEIHEVDIYFKSLGYAFILLDKKIKTIGMGAHIYIYTEIGKQGRILAFAEVVKQIPPKGLIEKEELDEADEGPDEEETIELLNSGKEHKF